MAAPVVSFIGTKAISGDDTTPTWIGGSVAANTDTYIEGTASISDKVSATTVTTYCVDPTEVTGEPWNLNAPPNTDDHIYAWIQVLGVADTLVNGGMGIVVADDAATDAYGTWYVGPQSGYTGGWNAYVINPALDFDVLNAAGTAVWTAAGNPDQLTAVDGFGARWKVTSMVGGASDNAMVDAISVGTGYRLTNGDAGSTEGKFSDFSVWEETSTNRFGALKTVAGIIVAKCKLRIGAASGATNTEFIDSGFVVVWDAPLTAAGTLAVASTFYALHVEKGTGTTDVTLSNGSLQAVSPAQVYIDFAGATSVTITNLTVDRARLVDLDSAVNWVGGTVKNSGLITASGAIFKNINVQTPTVAADASAVLWNDSGDPDGNLDGCVFTKGTNAHHAIELGTSAPSTVTLRNMTFTSFNASNGNNDSVIYLADKGSDTSWTINAIGCTGTVSYKKARSGDTVTVVQDPVTFSVHVQDINTGSSISGARVWVPVTSTAGGKPFDYTFGVGAITRSGSTATASHTGHNMATNDWVHISGATQPEYNGTHQITVTGTDSYTFAVSGTPASPATGTIKAKFVVINGTTDGSGNISATYTWAADQPVSGRVRKASAAPLYKTAPIAGTIDSTAGLSVTIQMIPDT